MSKKNLKRKNPLGPERPHFIFSNKDANKEFWLRDVTVTVPALNPNPIHLDNVFVDTECAYSLQIPLTTLLELFGGDQKQMKKQCQVVDVHFSNGKKEVGYHFLDKFEIGLHPLSKAGKSAKKSLNLKAFGVVGFKNAETTLGLLGLEELNFTFDEKMKTLIKYKRDLKRVKNIL